MVENGVAAGFDLTTEWSAAVLRAEYPVHDGTRLAARQLKRAIRRHRWRRETSQIERDLGRIEELTDWVAVYPKLLGAAISESDQTFLSGTDLAGARILQCCVPMLVGGPRDCFWICPRWASCC